jgi:hypothetical protein
MGIIDQEEGGPNRAPKFPLPNNYQFLMRWAVLANQKHVLDHVHLTLKKMAFGGIYDQVGGGFSRYSTDVWWKVPHFEKMLYDNGQLLSLYSEAFLQNGDADYKQVCINTANFIKRELTAQQGYFFSALDADSEGVEGKFYVWTIAELKNILSEEEFRIACAYYNINEFGYWEHDNYILIRREENRIVCEILEIHEEELDSHIQTINNKLLSARSERIRPGLDDKFLCSWNAMTIRGLADLSIALDDFEYYEQAKKASLFLLKELKDSNGRLWHTWKNGKASVPGFLEDYAFLINAMIGLYQASFESQWLFEARDLLYTVFDDFELSESGLFYFTSSQHGVWVARQLETSDNVQPASNSMMARNLNTLGIFLEKSEWILQCDKMLRTVRDELMNYGAGYSNWAMLALERVSDFKTLVICGPGAKDAARELQKSHRPDLIIAASENENLLPLFEGRAIANQLTYFVCRGSHCEAPVYDESKLKI